MNQTIYLDDDQAGEDDFQMSPNKINMIRALLDGFTNLFFVLEQLADTFEKMKNTILWKSSKITMFILVAIIPVFYFVSLIPLRPFIILGIANKFFKGTKYWDKVTVNNTEVCRITLLRVL